MAKCKYCNREMLTADGCGCTAYLVHGKKYPRIKVGDWQDYADRWYWSTDDDFKSKYRCGDCGAKWGFQHHPGCDLEVCPVCGGQALSCECLDEATILNR